MDTIISEHLKCTCINGKQTKILHMKINENITYVSLIEILYTIYNSDNNVQAI